MWHFWTWWYGLAGFLGLVWLIRINILRNAAKRLQVLTATSFDGPPADPPLVSVIVAAKDEEANIETCIATLLQQDYPRLEIIAVNDRSTDRTLQILQKYEAESADRLRVFNVTTLAEGWFGKNNAMRTGIEASRGEWICMIDADCRQTSPHTISMAMREAIARKADFLTITPVLDTPTALERIIMPAAAGLLMVWFRPSQTNNPRRRTAYANGPFMLVRRDCYHAIGGHERVKTEVNEDIHLARLTKEHGFKLRVVQNDGLFVSRMYRSFAEMWRGWSRIYYGSFGSTAKLLLAAGTLAFMAHLPWAGLAVSLFGWLSSGSIASPWAKASGLWAIPVVLMQVNNAWYYRIMRAQARWSLTYPLGSAITVAMLFNAALKAMGATSTTWRGTTYHGDRVIPEGSDVDPKNTARPRHSPPAAVSG